jgi:transposase
LGEVHKYPSDITREQFGIIRPLLENSRKKTKPPSYDIYDVFCGILYLLKSGCQWRMIPSDFPPRGTVRYYYDIWAKEEHGSESVLSEALKKTKVNAPKSGVT